MGKKLIITEKPSVARDFARVLRVSGNNNGYIENDTYVISWCFGHLVEMSYPEAYDEKYKTWRLEDLPFLPKEYKYGVIQSSKDQYALVNKLLHREDIDTVYWAGDSGKEGQTIEENIRNYGGVREGMTELRVWIDSQTDDEIMRGIREAKPMSDYARLGKSGIMRTIEDYSLGINFSRALSVKYGRMINDAAATSNYTAIAIGRVMTCVLGMVVNREREIRDFIETPFYRIMGSFGDAGFKGEWRAVKDSKYFESPLLYKENGFKKRESAENLINDLTGKSAVIDSIETSTSNKRAPLLFNLAELQSECSKIFKISPAQTLDVVQELYEKKLTTYPRTDARVLTTAIAKEISKNIRGLTGYPEMAYFAKNILDNRMYIGIEKSAYTDDSKVTDHYAIIPTGQTQAIGALSDLAKSVYNLICKRFLSIFYPAAEYKNVKMTIVSDTERFFTSAKVLSKKGYMEVAGVYEKKESDDDEGSDDNSHKEELLAFAGTAQKGDEIVVQGYEIKEGKTSPPKRYTSGNLILAMENAGNLIEDEELREQIKKSGIGTSATRGEILDKLVRIKYLNQNQKTQIITPEKLGEMIYEVVKLSVPTLLNPEMTANWEMGLEGIINGTVDDLEYRSKLEDYIRRETTKMISFDLTEQIARNINRFTGKDSKGVATRKKLGIKCPMCGGELTTTSFGYGCSNYFDETIKCKFNVGTIAGVDLPEEDFVSLVTEGKTKVIDGFVGKSKKLFSAALVMNKDDNGVINVNFDFSEVPARYLEGAVCPACGKRLMITGYGVTCEDRTKENGCYFGIGEIAGKHLDDDTIVKLINEGATDIITGFKSKNNAKFNAKLKLVTDDNGRKSVAFDFEGIEAEKLKDCKCPDCGSDIIIKSAGYGCSAFDAAKEESCKFFIGKTIAGKTISPAVAEKLIKEGKTETLRGFKGKSGKKFDAVLILQKNESGRTEVLFDFDNVESKVVEGVKCPACGGNIVVTQYGFACENRFTEENKCYFSIGEIAGKKISEADVKELLTNGISKTIRGFKGKSKKAFDACLKINTTEDGKKEIVFDFENVEEKTIKDVKCPVCGGDIVKTKFGFGCKNYNRENPEAGCRFNIGTISGVKITEAILKELLNNETTSVISGFKSKSGNSFDAKLTLARNEEGVVTGCKFVFEDEDKVMENVKCPKCGSSIIKGHMGYRCASYVREGDGCKFFVGKIAGVELSEEQFTKLITDKKTDKIQGFLSKKGSVFDAVLKLDENSNIVFDFES
ncbi:MAG: topoisomerase C-terminal repeat-containing protein [Lachnospiraceae bacterium]|nr:topoisomerase C-terminal repeat-containing protein [Lachnospiraceae bacterium]